MQAKRAPPYIAMAEEKFVLPSPRFQDEVKKGLDSFSRHLNPHFSTPNGMLLPSSKQPPPMFGPRGSTVPAQFLNNPRKRPASGPHRYPGPGTYRQNQPGGINQNQRNNQGAGFKNKAGGPNHRSPRPPNNGLEKDVKPELLVLDWKLWCEGCDVNCRSEEEFEQHKANHAPCTVPGCTFVGHPMIMKRHGRQVHSDGGCTKDTIGPSAEEIEQWKEERRKRYPTKQNVILRQQAQEARFNRGERIEEKKDRFPKRNAPVNDDSSMNGPNTTPNGRNANRSKRKRRAKKPAFVAPVEEKTLDRIPFKGTSSLKDYKDPPKNALSMLGDYGTDTDSSCDEEEQASPVVAQKKSLEVSSVEEPTQKPECTLSEGEIEDDGDDAPSTSSAPAAQPVLAPNESQSKGAVKQSITTASKSVDCAVPGGSSSTVVKHPPKQQNKPTRQNNFKDKRARNPNRPLLDYSKLRRSNQNTMLEKLLDADIRHERNVLLQCVRYVLVNKFFGIGQPKEVKASVAIVTEEASVPVEEVTEETTVPVVTLNEEANLPVVTITEEVNVPVVAVADEANVLVVGLNEETNSAVEAITQNANTPAVAMTLEPIFPVVTMTEEANPSVATVTEETTAPVCTVTEEAKE
ncbi:nuclear fragile X mental retardation-interacting protein 1 [Anopheles arabiensis]|nr:nuclear fragile X mental retardation-interacting protein 1 [Anopheles arabiensis]